MPIRTATCLRWAPLAVVTVMLVVYAAYSKQPSDPFQWRSFHFALDLSPAALAAAATKAAHWVHFGVTCLLAYLALGRRSPFPAFVLTTALGLLVELEQ